MYISTDFFPEEEQIGGNLFKKGEIDEEYIQQIFDTLVKFVESKVQVTYNEILGYLSSSVGKYLNEKEILSVIDVLILDGKLSRVGDQYKLSTVNKIGDS